MSVMANPVLPGTLSPDHFSEIIADSAINPDVAEARGYRTLQGDDEDREELLSLGFTKQVCERQETYPALLVPMFRATGEVISYQLKPGIPRSVVSGDGKPRAIKYESPLGSSNHIDVPPFTQERLSDGRTPLWFTEGIKKVDSLVSQGRAAIGLTGVYNWRRKLGTLGDWEDIPLKGRPVVICFDSDARDNRNVQLAMRRFGAWLESKGAASVHYLIVPAEYENTPVKGVDDWFAAGGTVGDLQSAASLTAPADGPKDASFTDAVLTETVCEDALEGTFCWARGLGWMAWDGHVWSEVADTSPTEAVRVWAIERFQKILTDQKTDPSRDMAGLISGWRSVLSKGRIKALVDLSRGILEKNAADFDADPELLCVKNGYVDLKTGILHSPDPDKLMTRSCGTAYEPDATDPLWDKALCALPEDVRDWYQDRMGQAATGYMAPDDLMIISHGDGANGKSSVVSAIHKTLGGYAVLMSDRVLMASPDAHPTELMDLRGARCAVLEETPEARRLDVHRLKRVVGTELITARRIRQDDVTFNATHSLFVNTNFRPVVTETDHGTWRRLALLSFPYTYRRPSEALRSPLDRPGDPALRGAANRDGPYRRAVLAWIVRGAQAWFGRSQVMLPLPERVERDTLGWRSETDLIIGFAAEMLRFTEDGRTGAREMLTAFNGWTEGQGHKPWTEKTFASRFAAHDLIKSHQVEKRRVRPPGASRDTGVAMTWLGVTLGEEDNGDLFSPQNGTSPTPSETDKLGGVQGVQARPDNQNLSPITRVNNSACTPCTPQVSEVDGQNGLPSSGTYGGQNGLKSRNEEADPMNDPAHPTTVTESEGDPVPVQGALTGSGAPVPADESGGAQAAVQPRPDGPPGSGLTGFDLETRGSDWLRAGPGFIGLAGWGDRVDTSPEALVARMRAGGTWVGSNILGFDLPVLERHAGLRIEETYGRVRDTQLQAMLADPPTSRETTEGPRFKPYSLDAVSIRVLGEPKDERGRMLAAEYCPAPRCAHKKNCEGWEHIPASDPRYAAYCADDAIRSMRVHEALPWTPYMEREMKVQAIMARMTLTGFRVDLPLLDERIKEGEERKRDAVRELAERFGMPTGRTKELKNGSSRTTLFKSPLATSEGKTWLGEVYKRFGVTNPPRTEKSRDFATGAEVLRTIREHPKCPEELRTILGLMGIVTSERTIYGTIRDNLVGDRVHPDIWPRQASGRWSVGVGMTVMKKEEREVYIPDEGESIITVDMAQIDARIVAAHAQDAAYIELFAPGRDLHTETAIAMLGDAKYRNQCKPISHLANYGGGKNNLIGMGHDPRLVSLFFEAREEKFPGLLRWQDKVREIGASGQLLDNGFGRPLRVERHFAYTQAPAQVGQGGTRDMMAEGLLNLARIAPECLPMLRVIVHDEIVLSVPTAHVEEISRIVVKAFECEWAPPGASIPVHMLANSSRPGINWADAYGK